MKKTKFIVFNFDNYFKQKLKKSNFVKIIKET